MRTASARHDVPPVLNRTLVAATILVVLATAVLGGRAVATDYPTPTSEPTETTWPSTSTEAPSTTASTTTLATPSTSTPTSPGPSTSSPDSPPTSTAPSPFSSSSVSPPPSSTTPSSISSVAPPPTLPECPLLDDRVPVAGGCDIDPCVVRTGPGPDDGYETSVYRTGHVVGADNGTTRNHNVDCHVTSRLVPNTLPNTGSTTDVLLTLAGSLALVGLALVWVTRRDARKGDNCDGRHHPEGDLSDGDAS